MPRRRKFWGWGWEDEGPGPELQQQIAHLLAVRLGVGPRTIVAPPRLEELDLRPPRLSPPAAVAHLCSAAPYDRAGHAYGKSYRDLVRAFQRAYPNPPDLVAFPRSESDLVAILDWCTTARVAAIPYGGGSSVVAGVEPPADDGYAGSLSIDLCHFDRVLEVDRVSRSARVQAGVLGPRLEEQLRPLGLTLRHYPQSFEFSSLGGWIATRAGGHFATLYTHIDDFVQALRLVTPAGIVQTRRLPGSGAGPSPDRLFMGSEGVLGIITEAWMRLQVRPRFRTSCAVPYRDFAAGAAAARTISQAGLYPSNCRLLDPAEAETAGAGSGSDAILLLAFESADHAPDAWMRRALECAADHGGQIPQDPVTTRTDTDAAQDGPVESWRSAFLQAPYLRDALVAMGMITETFESAITWDRFPDFHEEVMRSTTDAIRRICGAGRVTCRFTHVYPDGPAPYYTVLAPAQAGSELVQWGEIKAAASETILRLGGTITHHHAVGRDHRPWYDRQRADLFAKALAAAKRSFDPAGILNPGVLIAT